MLSFPVANRQSLRSQLLNFTELFFGFSQIVSSLPFVRGQALSTTHNYRLLKVPLKVIPEKGFV
ncbi:hypothetical protein NUACC26_048560 [Scytonema sp. NUACC26]